MASVSQSPVNFSGSLSSATSASDLLRSSINGVNGVPLQTLGKGHVGPRRKGLNIVAKVRKVKKHEYPWPQDPDPNVKGGVLSHLSPFKPLKEKPKPVTLEFEKPLMDLQKKIIDVQKMANETGLDFSDQIISLENKYQQALKDLYTHLTPIQRVNIARHPNRPTFLDHVFNITDKFVELHGDRAGYDDPAVVTGIGTIDGRRFMFMGHQKGRNTKENIQRNFGMPTPHGYRKALRMMYYADHHGFPIVTFIDTPGAFADLKSEELGQGEAIAHNLRTMFGLKVPIVSIVMGEGGSGGALAIGCANKLLMLENAVFYVASPEACAAILWKTAKASPKAAEKLKITANELCKLQIADGIIPEPLGGAHADPHWTSEQIKKAILESMDELQTMGTEELLRHRMLKFRKIGGFQEGLPVEPEKKVNMKRKEEPRPGLISDKVLQGEVNKLKEQIMKAKESSSIDMDQNGLIEKLQREINYEFSEAAKALGIEEKLSQMREEFAKVENGQLTSGQIENLERLKNEFNEKLETAPNYGRLKYKLSLLKEITEAKVFAENYKKTLPLKAKVNEKFKEVLEKSTLKQKIENLKAEVEKSDVSSIEEFDQDLKEKVLEVREEVESEFINALESSGVHVTSKIGQSSMSLVKAKVDELNAEINQIIQDVIESTPDLKSKIEMLKLEVVKDKNTPSKESKEKIEALQQQIKEGVADVMSSAAIKEKYEQLQAELAELSGGSDGSLIKEPSYA
ncbi:putative acetyl-CoA carboxylase [Helianthus annuus]|uniref:acetyl-CoA carboxytransferase n=1 Tax=Helianthus annuus TaxID=4232 RepID=A0A9K3N339_HELAN|nr:acetyl-coenzyme A carboxylase carboxyl transferase subunit alpha, chloroplastic [Helianthus annuus]KAF5785526.1 putative acetyl-CoA carboxylase [Helianthus annuus]KAJ0513081.1 putative acetyl-CoA carboxylase [Helianthus annuus]KAJ0529195.1 putative acetyl-CoA carboxylase [Helianthus annuus]KAJ0696077.1 putative acetyl-CoA carboxylase [Helianthus annuus]